MITVRAVSPDDAQLLRQLARRCAPLDLHTPYTYWVIAHYFHASSFIAWDGEEPVGLVTAVPSGKTVLLWQIGVVESHRRRGVGRLLLEAVVSWCEWEKQHFLEFSIDPENGASLGLFRAHVAERGAELEPVDRVDLIDELDPSFREQEDLYRMRITAAG